MQAKLKMLSDQAFVVLKQEVEAEWKSRQRKLLRIGSLASFESSKTGETITIRLTGRGPKNFQGTRVDEFGRDMTGQGSKWRCHPEFLTPVMPTAPKGSATPRTAPASGSW